MNRTTPIFLVLFLMSSYFFAQESSSGTVTKDEVVRIKADSDVPPFSDRRPRYKLHPGDAIELTFVFTPDYNQVVAVQPDGFVTLREAGDLHVAGQTLPQLRQSLNKLYSQILKDPEIKVELKDFEKPFFIASGELKTPGKYELRGDTTVTQAVAVAGGFSEKAKHSQVLLFHRVSDDYVEVKRLDMKRMLAQADLREDLYLRPGDIVYVPTSRLATLKGIFVPHVSLVPAIRPTF